MNLRALKRQVEMLDAVSTGLHPSVLIAQLAEKYGVSERCLWSDWQRRAKWIPLGFGIEFLSHTHYVRLYPHACHDSVL